MANAEERMKILKMIEEGKISADEGSKLLAALSGPRKGVPTPPRPPSVGNSTPRWLRIRVTDTRTGRSKASVQMGAGLNFWFFCLTLPLLFGVLLIALGAGGRASRWIYVNVDRSHQNEWPRKITLALPIPLGLVSWFLKNFGSRIDGLKKTTVDDVLMAISMTKSVTEPLIVHVNDDNSGDRVQVFIG